MLERGGALSPALKANQRGGMLALLALAPLGAKLELESCRSSTRDASFLGLTRLRAERAGVPVQGNKVVGSQERDEARMIEESGVQLSAPLMRFAEMANLDLEAGVSKNEEAP